MAAPITHIVLALMMLHSGLLPDHNVKQFILGTTFPDIRYLGVIAREKTHDDTITWADVIAEKSSFMAGLKFHSLVDRVREEFMVAHHAYDHLPDSPYKTQSLKFTEDLLLFAMVSDWDTIHGFFKTIAPEEKSYGISKKDLRRWHQFNQRYILIHQLRHHLNKVGLWKPSSKLMLLLIKKMKLSKKAVRVIMAQTLRLENNKELLAIITDFYTQFPRLIVE